MRLAASIMVADASIVVRGAVIISATVTLDGSALLATIFSVRSRSVRIPNGSPSRFAISEPIPRSTIMRAASLTLDLESIDTIVLAIWRTGISESILSYEYYCRIELKPYREA